MTSVIWPTRAKPTQVQIKALERRQMLQLLLLFLGGVSVGIVLSFLSLFIAPIYFLSSYSKISKTGPVEDAHKSQIPDVYFSGLEGTIMVTTTLPQQDKKFSLRTLFQTPDSYIKEITKVYYAVLINKQLQLYDSNQKSTLISELDLSSYSIQLIPSTFKDSDVFLKQSPIVLSPLSKETSPTSNFQSYYLFCETNVSKEEWFLALSNTLILSNPSDLTATKLDSEHPPEPMMPLRATPSKQHLKDFAIDWSSLTKHISEIQNPELKCINAIFCRLFLGVYQRQATKDFFVQKILKKAQKVNKPSILGDILVKEFIIGGSYPLITNPKLLQLSEHGCLEAELDVEYHGGLKVVVETEAFLPYLGTFLNKNLKLPLVLSIYLKRLSGRLCVKVKQHPTHRLWLGFLKPPEMNLVIEPIISDKRLKFSIVLQAIERKIQEAMIEAMVLPNMDDYPFFNEQSYPERQFTEALLVFKDTVKASENSPEPLSSLTQNVHAAFSLLTKKTSSSSVSNIHSQSADGKKKTTESGQPTSPNTSSSIEQLDTKD